MIWKDYIYFSRSERNGIKILSLLLIVMACAPDVFQFFRPEKPIDTDGFFEAAADFKHQMEKLASQESLASTEKKTNFDNETDPEVILQPFRFNPNELSVEAWDKMGLPARLARTIHNYLAAGGTFRVREDLKRIYLMQDEWYDQLEPYIDLPSKDDQQAVASHSNKYQHEGRNVYRDRENTGITEQVDGKSNTEDIVAHEFVSPDNSRHAYPDLIHSPIDINRADTTQLTRIRGVGAVYSRRIFGYRNLLGGFHHPAQLLEVYGMDTARWEQLLPQTMIDTSAITKINLNHADYTTLLRHPYIDNNLAGALVNFRNQHSPLDSLAQIRESFLVTDEVFEKIAPYLKVE